MNPCAFCLELVQAMSSSDEGGLYYDFKRAIGSSCNFCEQLKQRYFASISSEQGLCEPVWALELYSSESLMHDEDNLRCQITIRGENTRLEFAVWADEGIKSCHAISSLLTRDQVHPLAKDSSNVRRCRTRSSERLVSRVYIVSQNMCLYENRDTAHSRASNIRRNKNFWSKIDRDRGYH
jgi:hypothetical protein